MGTYDEGLSLGTSLSTSALTFSIAYISPKFFNLNQKKLGTDYYKFSMNWSYKND